MIQWVFDDVPRVERCYYGDADRVMEIRLQKSAPRYREVNFSVLKLPSSYAAKSMKRSEHEYAEQNLQVGEREQSPGGRQQP